MVNRENNQPLLYDVNTTVNACKIFANRINGNFLFQSFMTEFSKNTNFTLGCPTKKVLSVFKQHFHMIYIYLQGTYFISDLTFSIKFIPEHILLVFPHSINFKFYTSLYAKFGNKKPRISVLDSYYYFKYDMNEI